MKGLGAADYEDDVASDPRIDALRARMQVREHAPFTRDYYDRERRYIGNAVQVFFADGTATERVQVDVPLGHRERRAEGLPLLRAKFSAALVAHFGSTHAQRIEALVARGASADDLPVPELMAALVR